ncbi:MAG: hypothetical protein Q8P49_01805 [Candidatus Liptonbacteria bacterium]|nr:hypothetical protein [Candidatus Liptonbacteria bacterium]
MSKKNFTIVAVVCSSAILIFGVLLFLPVSHDIVPEPQNITPPAPEPSMAVSSSAAQAAPVASSGQASGLLSANFQYPYPVSWEDSGVQFDLTAVSLGKKTYPASSLLNLESPVPGSSYYTEGQMVNTVTLIVKVSNKTTYDNDCARLAVRRVTNEEGDVAPPNISKFNFPSGSCGIDANTTYVGQEIPFVVSGADKDFTFTTGGSSNIFFSISAENGAVRVENISAQKQG